MAMVSSKGPSSAVEVSVQPSWTPMNVSDSEDGFSDHELELDQIMNINDTSKYFAPKSSAASSLRPSNAQQSTLSAGNSDPSDQSTSRNLIQTEPNLEISREANANVQGNSSTPALDSGPVDAELSGVSGINRRQQVQLASQVSLGSQKAGVQTGSKARFGLGEGLEEREERGQMMKKDKSSVMSSMVTKKKVQSSLSAYGFLSAPSTSPSSKPIKSKPKLKPGSTFLGVIVSSKTSSRSSSRPSVNGSSSRPESKLGTSKGGSSIVDALESAFSNNHLDSYTSRKDKGKRRILLTSSVATTPLHKPSPSPSLSDHSHSPSHLSSPTSTKPTSTESAANANHTFLGTSSSASSRNNSRLHTRKSTNIRGNNIGVHTTTHTDNDSERDDIDIIDTHDPPSLTQNTHVTPHDRTNSSTPDPLALHSEDDNDDDDAVEVETRTSRTTVKPRERTSRNRNETPFDVAGNSNSNSFLNALSNAFASPIGTPNKPSRALRPGAEPNVVPAIRPVVRKTRNGSKPGPARLPAAKGTFAASPSSDTTSTTTNLNANTTDTKKNKNTNALADALTRAFATNVDINDTPIRFGRRQVASLSPSFSSRNRNSLNVNKGRFGNRGGDDVYTTGKKVMAKVLTQEEAEECLGAVVADVGTLEELEELYVDDDKKEEGPGEENEEGNEKGQQDENWGQVLVDGQVQEYSNLNLLDLDAPASTLVVPTITPALEPGKEAHEAPEIEEIEEIETEGVIRGREEEERHRQWELELESEKVGEENQNQNQNQNQNEVEEEERKEKESEMRKWEKERLLWEINVQMAAGAKWARLVKVETELERIKRGYGAAKSRVGKLLEAGVGVEEVLEIMRLEEGVIGNGDQQCMSEEEREFNQRKWESQYASDGRSVGEMLLERVEEWFGPEFLTVKALGAGHKPKKPRVPQIPKPSTKDGFDETSDEEISIPPSGTSAHSRSRSQTPTVTAAAFGVSEDHVDGRQSEEDVGLGMKRARNEGEDDGIGNVDEDDKPAKRMRIDDGDDFDMVACPGLLQKLVKGKTNIKVQEIKMIEQFLEVLAGDDWSMMNVEVTRALHEGRDVLWANIVTIANSPPGSDTLGVGEEAEKILVGLALRVKHKFEGQ